MDAGTTTTERERHLEAVTTALALELQECRAEAADAASDSLRSWFDGRSGGIERALRLLDDVRRSGGSDPYQRRA